MIESRLRECIRSGVDPRYLHFYACPQGKGSSAPPPDPLVGQAAAANSEIARDALDFNKQVYEESKPRNQMYDELVKGIVGSQVEGMTKSQALADDYADYLKNTFRPVEQKIVADAEAYDTPERREQAAGEAVGDVRSQFGVQRGVTERNLTRSGVDPSSGRMADFQIGLGNAEAASSAHAANQARRTVEDQGYARRMDAVSLGRNLPSNQATSQSIALNAGNSAAGNAGLPLGQYRADAGMMNQGYGTAVGANQAAGNLALGQYNSQLNAWGQQQQADAAGMAGLGQLAGTLGAAAIFMSDEKVKTDKEPVEGAMILEGLKEIPVEAWKYKQGVEDGGRHIGPYAGDVNEQFGEQVAPGGVGLDLVSMNGVLMAGVKELVKKVERLEKTAGLTPVVAARKLPAAGRGNPRDTEPARRAALKVSAHSLVSWRAASPLGRDLPTIASA